VRSVLNDPLAIVSHGPTRWLGIWRSWQNRPRQRPPRRSTEVALNVKLGKYKDHVERMQHAEPTSPVALLTRAPTEPPHEHRSRAPEFYGFVAWSLTSVLFVVYVLWVLLPDEYILWLGVKWYPSRCATAPLRKKIIAHEVTANGHCSCPHTLLFWSFSHTVYTFRLQLLIHLHSVM
jgi:hypothetical protein